MERTRPSEIYYSQDTIRSTFRSRIRVTTTIKQLLKGLKTPSSIPLIEVRRHDVNGDALHGKYFVIDGHRRLFIYKVKTKSSAALYVYM